PRDRVRHGAARLARGARVGRDGRRGVRRPALRRIARRGIAVAVTPDAGTRVPELLIDPGAGRETIAPADAEVWPIAGGGVLASAYDRTGWHWLVCAVLRTFSFDHGGHRVQLIP